MTHLLRRIIVISSLLTASPLFAANVDSDEAKAARDPVRRCQLTCKPKKPDPMTFEQCMLDCRKPEVAQQFADKPKPQQNK